ncbi:hypothetical protein [Anoxybacteroides rupiense]|uniref:Uncharacterized protein n=1 Tax=Anoxybacteroides rupiense TaxID=311460 RepID=A0ABD5ITM6_9BACL|nr:hypothetical protein [Anoxybacillus rupiensis]MBB3905937.1 hypothetical protein [Anoxybacillus rupiensis]MED5051660.1 hypothetical protein [Anoxybacillus rupiensis]
MTQLEAGTGEKETEHHLETVTKEIEEKVETLTEEIEKETETKIRRKKRQECRKWKKLLNLIRENFLPRLATYKEQNEIFGDRNSYSKTGKDATFMCMKEDHMKNG